MKKVILGFVAALVLATATTCVNAATMTVNTDKKYTKGETVSVVYEMEATDSLGIRIEFDSKVLAYASHSTDTNAYEVTKTDNGDGKISITGFSTSAGDEEKVGKVTVNFTVVGDVAEDAEELSGHIKTTSFEGAASGDTISALPVEKIVVVGKTATEDPTPSQDPTPSNSPAPSNKPSEGGNKPTSMDKFGMSYAPIAAGIVVIAIAGVVLVKKFNK